MSVRQSMRRVVSIVLVVGALSFTSSGRRDANAEEPCTPILPEQRCLDIRRPDELCQYPIPESDRPATVSTIDENAPTYEISLNEAINRALSNSDVVRVLTGVSAVSSGRTIYDTAIANTQIDVQRGAFDPTLTINNTWRDSDFPSSQFNALDPNNPTIETIGTDTYDLDFGLSKRNLLGGTGTFAVRSNRTDQDQPLFGGLNPDNRTASEFGYRQPFLRGAGKTVNQAPIVLARIDTERSYFQYKNAVQQSVQGVIEAYWQLVFANVNVWARQQQVAQAEFALQRTEARFEVGDANAGEVAQTKLAYENFRASLLVARSDQLLRQAALLNILGLPPHEAARTVPSTPPIDQFIEIDWELANEVAQRQRPDIIELKLVLEADQQRRLLADNQARPQLDGVALYRWNGLEGTTPAGNQIRNDGSDDDWSLGVNFSVPLGLRTSRASLRAQDLAIKRDLAFLGQSLHQMQHSLAISLRSLDQFYSQYERFREVRVAARENLEQQLAQYDEGIVQFIVVLQAIVDWGNAVSSEANALTNYNTQLARMEQETGTILETHGVFFYEERFQSIGPLGRFGQYACYPKSQPASTTVDRYVPGDEPAAEFFELEDPTRDERRKLTEPEEESDEPIDMDQEVEFERVNPDDDDDKEMTDEEIDELLKKPSVGAKLSDFLKKRFR